MIDFMSIPANEPTKIEIELAARVAHIDRENAFLVYATFVGDLERTAAALNIRPLDVVRMADDGHWMDRLKPLLELAKSSRPGDVERVINRALNFVQAHRMRMVIERALTRLTGMTVEDFEDYIFTAQEYNGKNGTSKVKRLSARALADLAAAIEKCHSMTYAALGDTAKERQARDEGSPETAANDMYLKIAEAAQKVSKDTSPRAQLFDAQLEIATEKAEQAVKPSPLSLPAKRVKPEPETPATPYDKE
ncbi:MAG TPA: hypothetical protein VM656_04105 [Pyrinomonadaceae bacterium]|nr:hypothetical protein [Pyrinomonadaceae bacterium]